MLERNYNKFETCKSVPYYMTQIVYYVRYTNWKMDYYTIIGGLLHDIGKALSHEIEGPHAEIGADIAKNTKCLIV